MASRTEMDHGSPDEQDNPHLTWDLEDAHCATERFPWGKHKGQRFCDIPMSYILWVLSQDWMWRTPIGPIDKAGLQRQSLRRTLLQFLWSQPACAWLFEVMKPHLKRLESGQKHDACSSRHDDESPHVELDPSAQF